MVRSCTSCRGRRLRPSSKVSVCIRAGLRHIFRGSGALSFVINTGGLPSCAGNVAVNCRKIAIALRIPTGRVRERYRLLTTLRTRDAL